MKVMKERKANVAPETQVRKTFDEEDEDLLEFDTLNDQLSKSVREFESSLEGFLADKAWDGMIAAQKKLVEFSRSAISRKWTLNRRMLMARNELDGSAESERHRLTAIMKKSKTSGKRKCDVLVNTAPIRRLKLLADQNVDTEQL